MSEAVELEPCPFCGGPARTLEYNGTTQATCAVDGIECAGTDVLAPVAYWNRRSLTGEGEPVACPDREAVARIIDPDEDLWIDAPTNFPRVVRQRIASRRQAAFAKADAVLALLSGGGE